MINIIYSYLNKFIKVFIVVFYIFGLFIFLIKDNFKSFDVIKY